MRRRMAASARSMWETAGHEVKPEEANPGFTGIYGGLPMGTLIPVGDKGPELPHDSPGKPGCLETGGTESGTLSPDLQTVVNVWHKLPVPVQRAIMAAVQPFVPKPGGQEQ